MKQASHPDRKHPQQTRASCPQNIPVLNVVVPVHHKQIVDTIEIMKEINKKKKKKGENKNRH
jgi:hypothetical protein